MKSPSDDLLLQNYLDGRLSKKERRKIETRICLEPSLADRLIQLTEDELALQKWGMVQDERHPTLRQSSSKKEITVAVKAYFAFLLATVMVVFCGVWLSVSSQSFVVSIVDIQDAPQWKADQSEVKKGEQLGRDQSYQLDRGVIQIQFSTGVQALIAAPATFEITGKNSLHLAQGALLAEVRTKEGQGFTVTTPSSTNIDHGTVFGILVDKTGTSVTQVFEGEVNSCNSNQSTKITAGHLLAVGKRILHKTDGSSNEKIKCLADELFLCFTTEETIQEIENQLQNDSLAKSTPDFQNSSLAKGPPMLNRLISLLGIDADSLAIHSKARKPKREAISLVAAEQLEERMLLAGAPTDLAIGGGEFYNNIVTSGNNTTSVTSRASLITAINEVKNNSVNNRVVFINAGIEINLTNQSAAISVPAGVTIASNRGQNGSKGALIYKSNHESTPIFSATGDGVRFTGFRLKGPDEFMHKSSTGHTSRGIYNNHYDDLEVENMEIFNFSHAGVRLQDGANAHIHHSSIHDNLSRNLGYGVVLGGSANDVVIEYNLFDENRHSIAGSGDPALNGEPGQSYIARYNIVFAHANSHAFDMHGYNERFAKTGNPLPDSDPNKKAAGERIDIYDNTFIIGGSHAVIIRGVPTDGAYIYNNKFINPDDSFQYTSSTASVYNGAILQKFYFENLYLDANGTVELSTTTTTPSGDTNAYGQNDDFRYADFEANDDRRNDVFWATGNFDSNSPYNKKWYVSYNGTEAWKKLPISSARTPSIVIVLQDFDGNGISDVYVVPANWERYQLML